MRFLQNTTDLANDLKQVIAILHNDNPGSLVDEQDVSGYSLNVDFHADITTGIPQLEVLFTNDTTR